MSDRATLESSPLTRGRNERWATPSRPPQTAFVYDQKTILLHWCTTLLVGGLWILGQTIDYFPAGPWRVDARSVHISLGVTLAFVLVIRVMWRNQGLGALRPDRTGILERLAALGHWALYALVILAVIFGVTYELARGDNFFNLFSLPDLAQGHRGPRNFIGTLHAFFADALVILALGHALLALFHHYVLRDEVMRRMLPAVRQSSDAAGLG